MNYLDNITEIGKSRLSSHTREFQDTVDVLAMLTDQIQELENDLKFTEQTVYNITASSGVLLDRIGEVVGQSRNGLSDSDYRGYLQARILANMSDGNREVFIALSIALWGGTVTVADINHATFSVTPNVTITDSVQVVYDKFKIFQAARTAGVRILLFFRLSAANAIFQLDTVGQGVDQGVFSQVIDRTY